MLSSDRTRKLRAGVPPYEYAGAQAYGDAENRAVYADLGRQALAAAHRHGGAIVDATFRRASDADAFLEIVPDAGWIVCEAPPEVMTERARVRAARGDSVSDAGLEIVVAELAKRGRVDAPSPPLARVETTHPVGQLLAELARTLDAGFYGGDRLGSPDVENPVAA